VVSPGSSPEALELPGLLSRLRDPDFFARVRVDPELGAPVWPGGLDLDPLVLYARALGAGLPLQALPQVNPSD
jgi:hypothetical protein